MDINEILEKIKTAVFDLAKNTFNDYKIQAQADIESFWNFTKDDIKKYTELLAEKRISLDEYEFLIQSKRDLAEMTLIKQTGIAKTKVDKFKSNIISAIVNVIKSIAL